MAAGSGPTFRCPRASTVSAHHALPSQASFRTQPPWKGAHELAASRLYVHLQAPSLLMEGKHSLGGASRLGEGARDRAACAGHRAAGGRPCTPGGTSDALSLCSPQLSPSEKASMPFGKACLCPARAPVWLKHSPVWHGHCGQYQCVQGAGWPPLTEADRAGCSLLCQ